MSDRRRYPRVARPLPIQVGHGLARIATETVNVSCSGALCWVDRPVPVMTKVAVALALPRRHVSCDGVVVRCEPARQVREPARGRYRLALFFSAIGREDHRAIAEFVLDSMLTHAHGHRGP